MAVLGAMWMGRAGRAVQSAGAVQVRSPAAGVEVEEVNGKRVYTNRLAVPQLVAALDFSLSKPKQIVIAGEPGAADTRAMLRLVHDRFIPNKILLLADGGPGQQRLAAWLPFVKGVSRKDGRATAYICEDYVCQLPTADLDIAAQLLDGTWKPGSSE